MGAVEQVTEQVETPAETPEVAAVTEPEAVIVPVDEPAAE